MIESKSTKCWICWETEGTMIKACTGCKDPDLQFCHERCISLFLSNSLTLQNESSTTFDQLLPFVSISSLMQSNFFYCKKGLFNDQILHCNSLKCSRCMDDYNLFALPVNPLRVLYYDAVLSKLVLLMLVGFLILFAMCITLIKEADLYFQISGTTMKLDTFWIPKDVSVKQWTIVVVSSFSLLFFITSAIVFNHLTGYYSIKVTGKSEVKQETINMEYMN